MGANNGAAVKDRVRLAIQAAEAAGQSPPGRPALAKTLGTTDYQVRKALDQIARERELATTGSNQRSPVPTQPAPGSTERHEPIGGIGVPLYDDRASGGVR